MSPQNQTWASEMQYVIFDEVQTIAKSKDLDEEIDSLTDSYVKILSLVSCPFIALSATISNAKEFVDWLNKMRPEFPNKVQLVPAPENPIRRWTDLHLHYYKNSTNGN